MKRFLRWTAICVCLGIILWTATAIYAALTKSTSIVEVDAWQLVSPSTLVEGTAHDISASYDTILYLEIALGEATATDGVEAIIEVSYADDNWVQLTQVKSTAETPAASTINDATANAGDDDITLTDATTGDFDVKARKWFILESTVGNSESVKCKTNSSHTVTLCQDLLRSHTNGATVVDRVDEWCIRIPLAASYVRVLCNNVDADCDAYFTTRVSKVTAIQ